MTSPMETPATMKPASSVVSAMVAVIAMESAVVSEAQSRPIRIKPIAIRVERITPSRIAIRPVRGAVEPIAIRRIGVSRRHAVCPWTLRSWQQVHARLIRYKLVRLRIGPVEDELVVLLHLQRLRIGPSIRTKCQRLALQHASRVCLRVEGIQPVLQQQ